jgi:6-phosphofructokinase 1
MRKIAVLTSGGDAPGMNAAIRSVVRMAAAAGVETVGVRSGYRGLMNGEISPLKIRGVGNIINRGGTILGSARAPEFKSRDGQERAIASLQRFGIDGVIVIGGDGSHRGAIALNELGVPCIGIASTIDNDLGGIDTSIGVDTALNTALEMVDRLRDTATSHHRAFVIEVMGRHSGYLALMTGLGAGAGLVLTPEVPIDQERAIEAIRAAYRAGKSHFIVVAAEGSPLKAGDLADHLSSLPDFEVRLTILGHIQRGGAPKIFDRLLATRSAALAVEALIAGDSCRTAGLARGRIDLVPMGEIISPQPKVTPELCSLAEMLAR